MRQSNKVLPVATILAVIIGIALGALGFYLFSIHSSSSLSYVSSGPVSNTASSSGLVSTSAGSASASASSASAVSAATPISASTTAIDTGSWQMYTNYELGFTIKYPGDVTVDDTSNPDTVTFTFPQSYFSTVMKDSDAVSVTVNATCTPMTSYTDLAGSIPSQTVTMGGLTFTENYQYDVGAGSHHALTTYDTEANDSCYRISFASNGANDAGIYGVNDQSEISAINSAHTADAAYVKAVADAMINSFAFANTGAGENEAFYSSSEASSASSATSTIALTSISPTSVSVNGQIALTGSGFLGQNTMVWISNGTVNGVLWGGMPTSDSLITAQVSSQACTAYVGTSGMACPSYLIISPGVYAVTVANQNGTTDPVYLQVQ